MPTPEAPRPAAGSDDETIFARTVEAAAADVTHGEICACIRRQMGTGQPRVAA